MTLKDIIHKYLVKAYRLLPIRKHRIVFLSHLGKTYACNPRYLCEYLAKKYPGQFELVWIYDKTFTSKPNLPTNVDAVYYYSHKCLRMLATAGVIISNTRISDAFEFEKRTKQTYIQTWHSSIRLKHIEKDANLGEKYEEFAKRDSAKINLVVSGSEFSTNIFKNSFWYNGSVLETGTPRIDYLLNAEEEEQRRILKRTGLNDSTNYVLYAPTFRKDGKTNAYDIDFTQLVKSLSGRFGGQWKVLYRLLPNLKGFVNLNGYGDDIIDMTDYDDIQELIVISNILITDYSSCMFDALFAKKKCLLYASDLRDYMSNERGLYFTFEQLPFSIATNNDSLLTIIQNFSDEEYSMKTNGFLEQIGSKETGTACGAISQYILSRL